MKNLYPLMIMAMMITIACAQTNTDLEWKPVQDLKTGQAAMYLPLPANWQVNNHAQAGVATVKGPGGISVYGLGGNQFIHTTDPMMAQTFQMNGRQLRAPVPVQQLLRQEIYPKIEQQGYKLNSEQALPELTKPLYQYMSQLVSYGPQQNYYEVIGSNWSTTDNKMAFVMVTYMRLESPGLVSWNYTAEVLEAPKSSFEQAKQTYIYALANRQHNQQAIAAYNQNERNRWNTSNQQFQASQARKNASFQATQKAYRDASDAVFNSQRSIYETQSASFDRATQQNADMIHEVQPMYNSNTGETWEVDAGYERYFINEQDQIIQTNDMLLDPNVDPTYNDNRWQQMTPRN